MGLPRGVTTVVVAAAATAAAAPAASAVPACPGLPCTKSARRSIGARQVGSGLLGTECVNPLPAEPTVSREPVVATAVPPPPHAPPSCNVCIESMRAGPGSATACSILATRSTKASKSWAGAVTIRSLHVPEVARCSAASGVTGGVAAGAAGGRAAGEATGGGPAAGGSTAGEAPGGGTAAGGSTAGGAVTSDSTADGAAGGGATT